MNDQEYSLFYAFGGQVNNKGLKRCERYCPDRDRWEKMADMNEAHWNHSAIAMPNGCIYIVGGFVAEGQLFEGIECFDIGKGKWTSMEVNLDGYPRSGICTIPDIQEANKFYIIGGQGESYDGPHDEILQFDVQSEELSVIEAQLPNARCYHWTFILGQQDRQLFKVQGQPPGYE